MYDFWTHTFLMVWSIIGSLVGFILLLAIVGLIANEIFVVIVNQLNNSKNEENTQ